MNTSVKSTHQTGLCQKNIRFTSRLCSSWLTHFWIILHLCSWNLGHLLYSLHFQHLRTLNNRVLLGPCYLLTHAVREKKEAKQKIVIQEIINRYRAEGYHFTGTTNLQPNSLKDTSASPALETWASRTMPDFTKSLGYKKRKKKCAFKKYFSQGSWLKRKKSE